MDVNFRHRSLLAAFEVTIQRCFMTDVQFLKLLGWTQVRNITPFLHTELRDEKHSIMRSQSHN